MLVAITLVLQLFLPIWSDSYSVKAAVSGPQIVSLSPANGTSNVPVNSIFKVTFDESIKKNDLSKNIAIYKYSSNSLVEKYAMSDYRVTVSNNVLTLDARGLTLALDTDYYILIEAGAVANESNSALSNGINEASTWNFRTIKTFETIPPQITSVTNGLCAIGYNCPLVQITSPLQFIFNETVYVATGNITLRSNTDNRDIPLTSSEVTGSGSSAITIIPTMPLTPSTTYTVTVSPSNIVDSSGNYYAGGSWTFTTAASPLQLISKTPAAGASSVNVTGGLSIVLEFDKNVQGNTDINSNKMIRVRKVSNNQTVFETRASQNVQYSGSKVTINTGYALESNTSYYVTIDAGVFTQSGNSSAIFYGIHNATDWVFTTGSSVDTSPPYIVTTSPLYGSVTVGANDKIILTFNENVFPKSGSIEIREYNSNALYRSISVTSDRVTGGGSQIITIDPHSQRGSEAAKNFSIATRYYVKFNNSAFADAAGNQAINTPSSNAYNFQVSASASAPQLVTISPNNQSTTVATTTKFKATFDKSILIDTVNYNVDFIPVSSNGTTVPAKVEKDPNDAKGIIITPRNGYSLSADTDYYINISDRSIMDVNGNYFVGILNQYQWSFKTLGGDTVPPAITKSEVSGNIVRLVYNELLDETLSPSAASFYVTVGGTARNISSVSIEGNVVSVKLVSSVNSNQKVTISYTKPSNGQIRDLTGNQAPSFANQAVTNGFTDNNVTILSSNYSGSSINMTFSESLNTVSNLAYTQFNVTVNGTIYTISSVVSSGNSLFISMNQVLPANATVVVNYTSGLYPISGVSTDKVASFNHTVGTTSNGSGGTGSVAGAPTLQSITLTSNNLYLQYNEAIRSSSKPGAFQYTVLVNGRIVNVTSVTLNTNMVVLTLASVPTATDVITVSYFGTSSTLLDNDYNAAASFTNRAVGAGNSNGSGSAVTIQGAVLKGNTLTLNFSGNLDPNSVPTADSFLVRLSDNSRLITSITINGAQLVMKLSTVAKVGEIATVSYFNQANTLKSASGITVNGFTNMSVANQTTVLDALSDDYASATNGILLKTTASSTSSDISPGGKSVTKYTVNTEKLITAVTTLANSNMTTANIVFDVPATEKAAIVAYSIAALEAAKQKGNYTLVVNHGDLSYSIPLSSIDLNKAAFQSGGNSISNYLRIAFEEGSSSATSSLETAINRSGATIIEGPFAYELTIVNGSNSENAVISGNITRTAKSSANITNSNTTAVFYDEGIAAISAVPTTFKSNNGVTTITFKRPGNSAYAIVKSNKTFSDTKSHWAHNEITIMARKFIVEGHSASNFNPKANITRGEFATYIVKGLGLSANKAAAKQFKDVNSDSVMGGYIGAAVASGIVSGVSSSSFAPNSYITRQDMALMMVRAASYAGLSTTLSSSADSILNGYSDKSQLSSYAKTGVATAINLGIISGTTTTKLSPKQNATRAEGTLMIMRLLKKTDSLQY